MIYFLNILSSTYYFYITKKIKFSGISFFPIFYIWTIIVGFQYNVGTDYYSYLNIYNTDALELYFSKKEFLFYYLVKYLRYVTYDGQILFFVIAIIANLILYMIIKRLLKLKIIKNEMLFIFIFLFLSYLSIFYNQMNGLRNYIAAYFFIWGWTYLIEKKYIKYLLLIFLGTLFHRTCIYMLAFIFIEKIFSIKNKKILYKIVVLAVALTLILLVLPINEVFFKYGSKMFPMYENYFNNAYGAKTMGIISKIPRYVWAPFMFESLLLYKRKNNDIILWGILGYCIILIYTKIHLLVRLSLFVEFFTIFPIYYLLIDYIEEKKN